MLYSARQNARAFKVGVFVVNYVASTRRKVSKQTLTMFSLALCLILAITIYFVHNATISSTVTVSDNVPIATTKTKISPPNNIPPANQPPATVQQPALTPNITDHSQAVQSQINTWIAAHNNHKWSVVTQGLTDDDTMASYQPDNIMSLASVYKQLIIYPLLKKLPRKRWNEIQVQANGNKSVSACVEAMLVHSDNACGDAVAGYVGWSNGTKVLNAIGLTNTKLNSSLSSTARDVAIYLKQFHEDKLSSQADVEYIESLMIKQIYRQGIPAGCPDCKVYDNIGYNPGVRNDVAVIKYGNNQAYLLVIMTNGASNAEIAELAGSIHAVMSNN